MNLLQIPPDVQKAEDALLNGFPTTEDVLLLMGWSEKTMDHLRKEAAAQGFPWPQSQ